MRLDGAKAKMGVPIDVDNCYIEHIELIESCDFAEFCKNLYEDYDFIKNNNENMFTDINGTKHCILAMDNDTGYGVIIYSPTQSKVEDFVYVYDAKSYIDEVITELASDLVIDFAYDNETELELSKISSHYQIALRKGNGIAEMLEEKASSLDAFESFEITERWIRAEVNQELDEEYVLRLGEM